MAQGGGHPWGHGSHGQLLDADLQSAGGPLRADRIQRRHMKAVPGRKTDVQDAEWIADLLRHGLLRASFIPAGSNATCGSSPAIAVALRPSAARRPTNCRRPWRAPTLNSKCGHRHHWVSATEMLQEMIAGNTDPKAGTTGQRRLRSKIPQVEKAFSSNLRCHHKLIYRTVAGRQPILRPADCGVGRTHRSSAAQKR